MKPIFKNLSIRIFKTCLITVFICTSMEATAQIEYSYDAVGNRTKRKISVGGPRPKSYINSDTTVSPAAPAGRDLQSRSKSIGFIIHEDVLN